jgi:hypothetical protein
LFIPSDAADQKVRKVESGIVTEGDLRAEYQRRHDQRRETRDRWSLRERQIADARLVVFSAGLVLAFFVFRMHWPSALWLSLPLALFVALVVAHEPLRRRSGRAGRAMEFYEKGLARMEERWAGTGVSGARFFDLNHPYGADLDLFGTGSLFERLCTARTRAGEDALASWLLAPAPRDMLFERQDAVTELRPKLGLREELELLGSDVRSAIDPEALATWGKAPRIFPGPALRVTAAMIATISSAAVIGWAFFSFVAIPLLLILALEITFAFWLAPRVRRVLAAVDERAHDLLLLGDLLDRLEREPSQSSLLLRLRAALENRGRPASVQIRRLARLVHLLDARKNQLFLPIAALLLWKTQLAMAIDAWREAEGPAIAGWLAAAGEFEALCALAAYAAENPADPFPEILTSGPWFEAEGLGHPLIPKAECVRNDLNLGGSVRALVVSGSNMSGKSTLLRTAGVAAVMALAGAPVRAVRLRVSPLAVGATLRIQDSLQAGKSRFYVEITRVRQLVDLAGGPLPLFFLFDELFHGTNSHDRRIGAESVLRGLLDRRAIGLITTHDLALSEIATGIGPQAVNVHFEDHLDDGQMRFDYLMRPGVVEHSNALALMRAVGLEV